jgi:LuxR family maltose regulon positive regulatory protein
MTSAANPLLPQPVLRQGTPTAPVVMLVAGPGYGKTINLQALVGCEPDVPTVWLTLDPFDAEPISFFTALLRGMRRHIPAFGQEMEPLLLSGSPPPRLLVRRFLEAVEDYNAPGLQLVFDNFHHLTEAAPELEAAWFLGLERLPPGTRVFLGTRRRPLVPFARLKASGMLALFGPEELKFTPEEAEGAVRARIGIAKGTIPTAWQEQLARVAGWPLGLAMLANGPKPSLHAGPGGDSLEALSAYVAEECWTALSSVRRAWLCRAVALDAWTPDALAAVLEMPTGVEDMLAELEAECLITRSGDVWYVPAHLRSFLQTQARQKVPAAERAALARRAAAWHVSQNDAERALPHLLSLENWQEAIHLCQQAFPAMLAYGRAASVARCLEAFPAELAASQPWLLLWRGNQALRQGDHAAARSCYTEAQQGFSAAEHPVGTCKATLRLAMVALFAGDLAQYDTLSAELGALEALANPEDNADIALVRGLAAEHRGDHRAMRAHNEAVLEIPIAGHGEVAACHATALMNLHSLAFYHGDLVDARTRAKAVLALADTWRFLAYRTYAVFLLAHVELVDGHPAEAETLLRNLPDTWEDGLDFHERGIGHLVLGRMRAARGDWRQAEVEMGRAHTLFDDAEHTIGRNLVLEYRMWAHLAHGRVGWVIEAMQQAGIPAGSGLHDAALLLPYARALHLSGKPDEALAALDRALPELERQEARLHLARARRFEAAASARTGAIARALKAEAAAQELMRAWHYRFLESEDPALTAELAALHAPPQETQAVRPAPSPLCIRCLGAFEVRQEDVPLEARLRRKAKLVLAALALHPRGLRPADIAEALGRDTFTAANQNTLQADIAELRRTLEPGLGRGQASRYILLVDGRYLLNWDCVEPTDVAHLEQALSEAERLAAGGSERALQAYINAVALHTGPLLPDGFFRDYFQMERDGLTARVTRALVWLANHHRARAAWEQAEALLTQAITLTPCDESLYVERMELAQLLGRPERLRQIYWDCRKALKVHLGAAPSEAFEALHRQMALPKPRS